MASGWRVADVNYLEPLKAITFQRTGSARSATCQLNCTTCHQGVNKPLRGVSMLADIGLRTARTAAAPAAGTDPAAAPASATAPSAAAGSGT